MFTTKQKTFALTGQPVELPVTLRSWSALFAVIAVGLLGMAFYLSPAPRARYYTEIWQPLLMALWLAAASGLIAKAHTRAQKFADRAKSMLRGRHDFPLLEYHVSWLVARQAVISGIVFATLGLIIVLLIDAAWYWRLAWAFLICATYYFAGFGLWGAWIVTRTVRQLPHELLTKDQLNIYHADHFGGLRFAVGYVDWATLFMLTGATALPMAILFAGKSLAANSLVGLLATFLIALAILIWAAFSLMSSVGGRIALDSTLSSYRDDLLDKIAEQKRKLIEEQRNSAELETLNAKQEAAVHIRTGLFRRAGAWKDLFSLTASAIALIEVINALWQFDFSQLAS